MNNVGDGLLLDVGEISITDLEFIDRGLRAQGRARANSRIQSRLQL